MSDEEAATRRLARLERCCEQLAERNRQLEAQHEQDRALIEILFGKVKGLAGGVASVREEVRHELDRRQQQEQDLLDMAVGESSRHAAPPPLRLLRPAGQ